MKSPANEGTGTLGVFFSDAPEPLSFKCSGYHQCLLTIWRVSRRESWKFAIATAGTHGDFQAAIEIQSNKRIKSPSLSLA